MDSTLALDLLRDPAERDLYTQLSAWLATDTVTAMLAAVSMAEGAAPPAVTGLTQVAGIFPALQNVIQDVAERLSLSSIEIACSISSGDGLDSCCRTSFVAGVSRGHIILHARLFDLLTTDEIRAVLAHEIAHLYYGHPQLALCIEWLDLPNKTDRLYALANLCHYWHQLAELAADRAAILAVDDPKSAITCLTRRHLGGLADKLDLAAFIEEQSQRLAAHRLPIPRERRHPPWEFRVLALDTFLRSGFVTALQQDPTRPPSFPKAVHELAEHLKVSPTQAEFPEFCFLLAAGNYLNRCDHTVHGTEIHRLRDILSRLIHAPDETMINGAIQCTENDLERLGAAVVTACPERCEPIFGLLTSLVIQDGRITSEERDALDAIGRHLAIPPTQRARIMLKILRQEFHPTMGDPPPSPPTAKKISPHPSSTRVGARTRPQD